MNLSVKIGSSLFPSPVTVASGTFGRQMLALTPELVSVLGAVVPKTVTLDPREGNPPPRIVETPAGMLNAIGIENPGVEVFIERYVPEWRRSGVPLIVSVLGHTDEEFEALAERLNDVEGVDALELNLSCPNLGRQRLAAQDPAAAKRIVHKVRRIFRRTLLAKLSPNVTDISEIAVAVEQGGADGVSMVNTFAAMAIDVHRRRPKLGNVIGGLSGPAIRPIALRMVHQAAARVKIPIVAMGGIMTAEDALEFLIAGASMVAVGTAQFIHPEAVLTIYEGIRAYMRQHDLNDIAQLTGSLREKGAGR